VEAADGIIDQRQCSEETQSTYVTIPCYGVQAIHQRVAVSGLHVVWFCSLDDVCH